jgi:addiction module HigA family antidote
MSDYKITDPAEMAVRPGDAQHPGTWIKNNVLNPLGLNTARTARLIGMDRASLTRALAGDHAVSDDLAYKLEALTGVDADLLIGLQVAYNRSTSWERRNRYAQEITRVVAARA